VTTVTTGSAAAPLRLSTSRSGDGAVLRLVGEVDVSNCGRLQGRLRDLLEPGRPDPVRRLVLDAAGLEFLDLAGLRVLLCAEAALRRRGGQLVVRAPARPVRRLLSLLDPEQRIVLED
jgi:anti-anti-sigma factor